MVASHPGLPLTEGFLGCHKTSSTKNSQTEVVGHTRKYLYSYLSPFPQIDK